MNKGRKPSEEEIMMTQAANKFKGYYTWSFRVFHNNDRITGASIYVPLETMDGSEAVARHDLDHEDYLKFFDLIGSIVKKAEKKARKK